MHDEVTSTAANEHGQEGEDEMETESEDDQGGEAAVKLCAENYQRVHGFQLILAAPLFSRRSTNLFRSPTKDGLMASRESRKVPFH